MLHHLSKGVASMARSLVKNVKEIDSCFLLLADDKYCASCAAEATCRDRRQQPKDSFEEVPPAPSITPEPCANCFNPDASGPVCMACRYPKYMPNPAIEHPAITSGLARVRGAGF
jgi:hypothetical protein